MSFTRFRLSTSSRSFTVIIDDQRVSVVVPLADFANHDYDGVLEFDYIPEKDGFLMDVNRDIQKGNKTNQILTSIIIRRGIIFTLWNNVESVFIYALWNCNGIYPQELV